MDFLSEIIQNIVVFVEQIGSIILTAITEIGEFLAGDFFPDLLTFFSAPLGMIKNYLSTFPYAVLATIIAGLLLTVVLLMLTEKILSVFDLLDRVKMANQLKQFFGRTIITPKVRKPVVAQDIIRPNAENHIAPPISFAQAFITVSLLAFLAYSLPQKYQLANLTQNHQNNQTQVAGETQGNPDNQGKIHQTNLFALKESRPNLYQLLTTNTDRRPSGTSLQLGMLSINPQGQLFLLPKSISSKEIKNHEVKNQDLADNSITSNIIKNHTIRSIDLQRELTIEELKINQNLTVRGNLTTEGSLTAVDMNLSGNLDLQDNLILNIGNTNTDFTTTGGLNLAGNLNINNQFLVNATSGNVGIGTTSPATIFHINQPSDSNGLRLTRLGGTAGLHASFEIVNGATTPYLNIGVQDNLASRNIIFAASGGGNIGIGSTAPSARLQVVGIDSSNSSFAANIAGATGTGLIVTNSGNVGIGTTNPTHKIMLSGGAYSDGVNWTDVSDRNLKTNFITLDPQTVLTKIVALPITQWNYKTESANIKHIGTMAQDFYAQFGLGGVDGNTSISAMDTGGVALLGIQALNAKTNAFITSSTNQITGLTENQNKIVNQLTGQLADQSLSVDNKLQLIGASLDALTTEQIEKLKDQIIAQTSDIDALQAQMADIETNMYIERYDELWSFYQNFELAKVPLKNALENVFEGKITAQDIEALNTIKAKDIEATDSVTAESIKGQNLELGAQVSGTSMIRVGELESAKILTTEARAGIKLYITPKGSTQGKTLFYDESDIDSGVGFKVKIDAPALDKDVEFNWLIVK